MKLLMMTDSNGDPVCINPLAVRFMRSSDVNRNDTNIFFVDGSHMRVKSALPDTMNDFNKAME